jgi:hypothetical protein
MLSRIQLEDVFSLADDLVLNMPVTYQHLMGYERLAVLPLLKEPIQSTLHSILQQKVVPGTKCFYKDCDGILDATGTCSESCSSSGENAIIDIITCKTCDSFCFPCPTCWSVIFNKQLRMYLS